MVAAASAPAELPPSAPPVTEQVPPTSRSFRLTPSTDTTTPKASSKSRWAVYGGWLSLISIFCLFPAPLALLFGILGVRDISKNPEKTGMVRAIFAIVIGVIWSLFLIIGIYNYEPQY